MTAALATSAVALAASACVLGDFGTSPGEFESIALQSLWLEGGLALIALWGALLLPGGAYARLGLAPGRLATSRVGVLAIGTLAASAALDGLLDLTPWKAGSALADFDAMLAGIRGRSLLLGIASFALMPGIAEELLCRGLLQRSLVARLGPAAGIAIASLIFGGLHLDPIHALFAVPLGLYLGLVCWISGGIRASIVCHTANNLTALLAGALVPACDLPAVPAVIVGTPVAIAALTWVWIGAGPPAIGSRPGTDEAPGDPPTDSSR